MGRENQYRSTLVWLCGPPAVGKMAVGLEVSRLTGIPLFHNHVSIEAVLPVFEYGTPPGRWMEGLLFDVEPWDPITYAGIGLTLSAVAAPYRHGVPRALTWRKRLEGSDSGVTSEDSRALAQRRNQPHAFAVPGVPIPGCIRNLLGPQQYQRIPPTR